MYFKHKKLHYFQRKALMHTCMYVQHYNSVNNCITPQLIVMLLEMHLHVPANYHDNHYQRHKYT